MGENLKQFSVITAAKWVVISGIGVLIVAGNYYYSFVSLFYRILIIMGLFVVAGGIFYTTEQGRAVFKLMMQARVEIGRVVWPTRPEIMQTFISVLMMVGFAMLLLWALDSFFSWGASVFLG